MNDFEIIDLARQSNADAYNLLLHKYDPLIKKQAKYFYDKYHFFKLDKEDLEQEGRLGLCEAIKVFDEKKDVLFYTIASLIIKRSINRYVLSHTTKKNYYLNSALSLESKNNLDVSLYEVLEDTKEGPLNIVLSDELESIIYNYTNDLNLESSSVFFLKLAGFSNNEISLLLDIDYKKVDNKLYQIRKRLLALLKNY